LTLFAKKQKDKSSTPGVIYEEDEILGYIDEVFRQRQSLSIRTKSNQWDCNLYFIDVNKKILRIEDSLGLADNENKPVQCGFSLDRAWFLFQSKIIYSEGKPHLLLPSAIKHHERRKHPRVTISPRENVRVSVLQSLGAGIGITGLCSDVSLGGICVTIERAIKMENEQKVSLHRDLLPKGTELMIVKVKSIPGVPPFDAPGIVNRLFRYKDWKLAVEFPKLPGPIKKAIDQFIQSRYFPYKPTKRSYQRRQEIEREREKEKQEKEAQQDLQESETTLEKKQELLKFVSEVALEIEPPLEIEEIPSPGVEEPKLPVLLSIGDELKEVLAFLENVEGYDWVPVETPLRLIKYLRERKTGFLLLPLEYKRQSMLEYLEKMSGMGILDNIEIIILAKEQISPKDLIKCRMLGVKHTLPLPPESPDQVLKIITPGDSSLP
jgi:hypothetical protein